MDFKQELESLINRYSQENGSHTPDFILAEYLTACLVAFDAAVKNRDKWVGVKEEAPVKKKGKKKEKEQEQEKTLNETPYGAEANQAPNQAIPAPIGVRPTTGYGNPFGGTSWGV